MSKSKKETNVQTLEEKYQKLEQREHVLKRPGMYIGSVQKTKETMQVFDEENTKIITSDVSYTPGFWKTLDELFVNARDQTVREPTCNKIKISYSKEEGWIKVWNDGHGLPVEIHKEHKVYVPELVFGHLLSGSGFSEEKRTTGSVNGLGAKLCNIYAIKFIVKTVDTVSGKKKFEQEFRNNMTEKDEPIISKIKASDEPYTEITYYPDFEKFGMKGLTQADITWIQKRAYDICACTRDGVKVYINDQQIKTKTFDKYVQLYYSDKPTLIYKEINNEWKVGIVFSPDAGNHHVSFVNGINTYKGGTHVDYILNQIVENVTDHIKKKKKLTVKPMLIKEHLDIFVDATIVNPEFPSQTKSELTTKVANFGTTCSIPESMMKELFKTELVDIVVRNAEFKEASALSKTDGKKQSTINVPKLEDAKFAGTKKSADCRCIFTEGDSAKAFALNGLSVIGKEYYGVFPLRGKLLNVRNASIDQIKKNQEFIYLKQIMGLKQDTKYTDVSKLRYGGIVILTDQDADGSHIKGLIINLFQYFWPELLQIDGFIQTLSTPLIKAFKKTDKTERDAKIFYTESEFNKWAEENDTSKWKVRYYKGLGTSTQKEHKDAFRDFDKKVVSFVWEKLADKKKKVDTKKKKNDSDEDEEQSEEESEQESEEEDDNEDEEEEEVNSSEEPKKAKKKVGGKRGKLALTSTNPEIINSESYDAITKAFDKDRVEDRKDWLKDYNINDILEYNKTKIPYSEFINKDLIHFSNYDNIRSIPSIVDGMKPSQRKIIHVCLKDNIVGELKVNQLASRVSEKTMYKHGEVSLEETIINMAQDFTGANNLNLLMPKGTFGYRNEGGKNHAASRYLKTCLENITRKIFHKYDDAILNYMKEEGEVVEPDVYYPVIPMVLVNGAHGIGTGFSTSIPKYNPIDVCNNIIALMNGEEMEEMIPYYQGFKGEIEKIEESKSGTAKYKIFVIPKITGHNTMDITELPIEGLYSATDDYEEKILKPLAGLQMVKETKEEKGKKKKEPEQRKRKPIQVILSGYDKPTNDGANDIHFELKFIDNILQQMIKNDKNEIEDTFKLSTTISTSNMYLYNSKGVITKYKSVLDIIKEFYKFRLAKYGVRKQYYLRVLANELEILKQKVRFIKDYLAERIIVAKQKRDKVIENLVKLNYPKLSKNVDDDEDKKTYDYITVMQLFSLTSEKIEELENEKNAKQKEYDDYASVTEKELWRRELEDFMTSYQKWLEEKAERDKETETTEEKKSKAKTPAKKRTTKSA
jgi:DNA topoisomerase-2